jgi:hypothetical protein
MSEKPGLVESLSELGAVGVLALMAAVVWVAVLVALGVVLG